MIKKNYVDVTDGQLHFRSSGASSESPLLLFHMTPSHSESYEPLMNILATERQVIAFDTPNYGASYKSSREPSVSYLAATMLEAMDKLGIRQCHVLGHHTGASIALEMAVQAGDRIRSATLSGLVYSTPEEMSGYVDHFVKDNTVTAYGTQLIGAWSHTLMNLKGKGLSKEYLNRETTAMLLAGETWHWGFRAVFSYDAKVSAASVACPIFLVCGEEDSVACYFHRLAAQALPKSTVHTPPDGGIDYMEVRAVDFAPHLIKFLRAV